jgi:tight adherence protein C
VASGLSSVQSWENVLYLMSTVYPKTSKHIALLVAELRALSSHDAAWTNFMARVNNQGIRDAIRTMHQCEVNGIPLGKDLSVEIEQINKQYLANIELKIAKLPTYMMAPIFLFIFPSLFIITIGPAIIKGLDSFSKMH